MSLLHVHTATMRTQQTWTLIEYPQKFCLGIILLMAHQSHSCPFRAADGRRLDDHPHFHELDFFHRINGAPGTRRPVPPSLRTGMNSAELLEAFLNHYYFSDGLENVIEMPSRKAVQKGLEEFF